ncbi:MAG: DJ-1/PfpI family protein [Planctomycetaceae bacterium]|nr:DJ-1/PfpI family protein [Planctomycetaceae bacterium]
MSKVLLIIGDATEVLDTMYPFFRLPEDDFEVVVAGPEVKLYHMVMHEQPPGWDITQESSGYHLQSDIAFRDINPDDYIGIFISGGRAPEYLRYDQDLLKVTKTMMDQKKPVASVCHGIEILAAAGCLEGRTATTVAKCAIDITSFGGNYVDEQTVIDDNLVSARVWMDNTTLLKEFVRMLKEYRSANG